ncbi:hypothetical protein F4803DRAFT_558077 [Xylaria telfairii]|nr:hypothetical protein F4803DRAFT_558077 [Xylaria telfairii]
MDLYRPPPPQTYTPPPPLQTSVRLCRPPPPQTSPTSAAPADLRGPKGRAIEGNRFWLCAAALDTTL